MQMLSFSVFKEHKLVRAPSFLPVNFNLEIPSDAKLILGERRYTGGFKVLV
jgi:hypothetical protein